MKLALIQALLLSLLAAVVAAAYATVISFFVHREMNLEARALDVESNGIDAAARDAAPQVSLAEELDDAGQTAGDVLAGHTTGAAHAATRLAQ